MARLSSSGVPLTDDRWTLEAMLHAADAALAGQRDPAARKPLAILRRRVVVRLRLLEAGLW